MGVLGLTPFLQRTCPEVIKHLPDRLRGLAGKKVVIDGTLITTRFHFAPAPHPYRHVLGWYRLAKELKEAGVEAVCVFDGKQRHAAKALELQRRKDARRKTAVRGALEQDRSKRLRKLSTILKRFQDLDSTMRERAARELRRLSGQDAEGTVLSEALDKLGLAELQMEPSSIPGPSQWSHLARESDVVVPDDYATDEDFYPALEDVAPLALFSAARDAHYHSLEPFVPLPEDSRDCIPPDHSWYRDKRPRYSPADDIPLITEPDVRTYVSPFHVDEVPHTADEEVLNQLLALYRDYRESIPKLASLATTSNDSSGATSTTGDPDTQADIVMTKAQHQLVLDEGDFWGKFLATSAADPATPMTQPPEMALARLSRTSDIMYASFERRMNPPTMQTYRECKDILQALGIPCLEASGPHEAEALASSIVLQGLADYVASEDTDVLVYEAPLIRNLTNRNSPLTIVSGADIRTVLHLDRASFVDFALLLGTDFSQRIKNVGPARALKFIREHGSIERVIELEREYLPRIPREAYLAQVKAARMVFRTLPPVPEKRLLEQNVIDEAQVIEVLQRYGLGQVVMEHGEWDHGMALEGNYFNDNPSAM
ncbi:putative PIN domain-like protein [Lyophyllum shimeji]|uniref:Exonuclease 1 n=1 Tax=Lyophyllum shimeji TaxID=47721 RepID=A0A9P3UR68_LYOSH|nr:putative PIN domain-like protein [Lyophyllum shimeji]